VKITPKGKVKVLDFGLAKAFQSDAGDTDSQSPTVTDVTREGTVLGTAAYMSPEQARGKPLDKRADIWSFGCVLYEALARKRAFGGESITDSIAAVLTKEPDWAALPEATPANVRSLLRRCLQKDAQKRLRDIGDARFELEEPAPELTSATALPARWRPALLYTGCLVLGAATAAIFGWSLWRPAPASERVARFSIALPPGEVLPFDHSSQAVLSPDGARLVYVSALGAQKQLFVRRLDRLEAKAIAGTVGARNPFFSPDGQWVAFWQNFKLKKLALSGGAPAPICDADWLSGGIWGADDNIVFLRSIDGISQVPASGGTPRFIARGPPKGRAIPLLGPAAGR
jgi:serine/threonine-protein kinase